MQADHCNISRRKRFLTHDQCYWLGSYISYPKKKGKKDQINARTKTRSISWGGGSERRPTSDRFVLWSFLFMGVSIYLYQLSYYYTSWFQPSRWPALMTLPMYTMRDFRDTLISISLPSYVKVLSAAKLRFNGQEQRLTKPPRQATVIREPDPHYGIYKNNKNRDNTLHQINAQTKTRSLS